MNVGVNTAEFKQDFANEDLRLLGTQCNALEVFADDGKSVTALPLTHVSAET